MTRILALSLLLLLAFLATRWREAPCAHLWAVHLCQPPNGMPSLIICELCGLSRVEPDDDGWGLGI